jgi:hypothetical protein
VKKLRLYPLALRDNLPTQRFIDVSGKLMDGLVSFDETYFERLARMINEEPVMTRDLVAMGQLRSIGIGRVRSLSPTTLQKPY